MFRRKATILCIDDHWNGLIGRKMLLEQSGYEVLEATDGDNGLKLFRTRPVDAVVLDYQMPGMNGDVVAAKMKRINSNVPIMLLSAYGPLPQSKLASVDSFVSKSQPPNALLSSLQSLLEGQPKAFFLPLARSLAESKSRSDPLNFLKQLLHRGCTHRFSWPRVDENGRHYQTCLSCGAAYEYDWRKMKRMRKLLAATFTPASNYLQHGHWTQSH